MEEGRVHFENQPLRNAAILESLDQVEDQLVQAIEKAGIAMQHIANVTTEGQDAEFQRTAEEFLHLVGNIHAELARHAHLVQDYRSYGRSTYGVEKDAELARTNVKLILSQLRDLRRYTDEHYAE